MRAGARNEDGAALILALAFITLIGVATAVLASLAFSSQKAAVIYTDQGRFANALDSGIQAAIENARVRTIDPVVPGDEPVPSFGCAGTDPAGPATFTLPGTVNEHSIRVTCENAVGAAPTASQATLRFTAAEAVPTTCPESPPPELRATVAFSTIGASATGYRLARTTSWKLAPSSTPCTP